MVGIAAMRILRDVHIFDKQLIVAHKAEGFVDAPSTIAQRFDFASFQCNARTETFDDFIIKLSAFILYANFLL